MILCGMLDLCRIILWIVVDLFRPRAAMEAEILVLRQQIIVLRRGRPGRVPFLAVDRMVLSWVCQLFPKSRWFSVLLALEVEAPSGSPRRTG
jgi:hypothetical protein